MNVKTFNTIFGYGFLVLGTAKIINFLIVMINAITNMSIIFRGGTVNTETSLGITTLIGGAEFVLGIGAIIMIFVNMNKDPEISGGYVLGGVAILLEFIVSGLLAIVAIFFQCGMFIKAGYMITDKNSKLPDKYKPKQNYKVNAKKATNKTTEEPLNNTDWFYLDSRTDNKEEKRAEKFKQELEEWKKLLDSGDIDQETYDI